ncbi:hypothetical protein IC807_06300 [Geobacillus zalihae]|uniref:Uncharacterized protein n=1 Tax=Geobacillus zalihae TaxID=213419 RepID=A0A7H1RY81_9BACL|nr:hypothetical protein [Geobacillus zalihae]QNU19220.1 hypothetical protein IC807_06300 [Geobacillus zalihae]
MDILNYQKILYINSIVRNKWFAHLVVSRMAGCGREKQNGVRPNGNAGSTYNDASRSIRSAASTIALWRKEGGKRNEKDVGVVVGLPVRNCGVLIEI